MRLAVRCLFNIYGKRLGLKQLFLPQKGHQGREIYAFRVFINTVSRIFSVLLREKKEAVEGTTVYSCFNEREKRKYLAS